MMMVWWYWTGTGAARPDGGGSGCGRADDDAAAAVEAEKLPWLRYITVYCPFRLGANANQQTGKDHAIL